jgi:hypothetical protein
MGHVWPPLIFLTIDLSWTWSLLLISPHTRHSPSPPSPLPALRWGYGRALRWPESPPSPPLPLYPPSPPPLTSPSAPRCRIARRPTTHLTPVVSDGVLFPFCPALEDKVEGVEDELTSRREKANCRSSPLPWQCGGRTAPPDVLPSISSASDSSFPPLCSAAAAQWVAAPFWSGFDDEEMTPGEWWVNKQWLRVEYLFWQGPKCKTTATDVRTYIPFAFQFYYTPSDH